MDVTLILEKLEQLGYLRLNKIVGNYYSVYCPFHKDGQERKPSCGVLLSEEVRNGSVYPAGWFHCFSCNASKTLQEAVKFLLDKHGVNQDSLEWLSQNVPGFSSKDFEYNYLIPTSVINQLESKFVVNHLMDIQFGKTSYITEEELSRYRYTVPYMYERKLNDYVIDMYDIGYDGDWIIPGRSKPTPCITFPVNDMNGNTLFICRRSIEGKFFHYPKSTVKPVYGLDKVPHDCKSLIICESCFNALTAVVYGYCAVALLGTGSTYQIDQLKSLGIREFIICMDGDAAGQKATKKLSNLLSSCSIVWIIDMPPGKDVNDCTKEEFDELYKNRR